MAFTPRPAKLVTDLTKAQEIVILARTLWLGQHSLLC